MLTNMGKISLNFIFFCYFCISSLKKREKETRESVEKRVIRLLSESETDEVNQYHFIMEALVTHFDKDWV